MKIHKIPQFIIISLIIIAWFFSGFPRIWQKPRIPSKVEKAQALNQLTNYGFANVLGAEWSVTDGTQTATQTAYGRVADAASQDGDGYVFQGYWTGSGNNSTWSAHCLWQTFTPTANVKAKLRGYYKRAILAKTDSTTVKLELLTGVTSCADGSVVATAFSDTTVNPASNISDADWTTAPNSGTWTSAVNLTNGTTYYVRIYFIGQGDSGEYGNNKIDNIRLNISPQGLSGSPVAGSTNVSLSWTASSGSPALNGTTPYKVYRDGASPVSTFLANATTNSYTDSSTAGNTNYYYAVSNVDINSVESPLSVETSVILTCPGASTALNFTSVTGTTLRLNWTAPTGGATSYKVERCQGAGCTPSQIASGVTNIYYDDSNLTCNTLYRYQVRATNASGDGAYSSIAEQTTGSCNNPPTGSFNSAVQKNNGSGQVDISIEVDDPEDNDTKAKIAYDTDGSCDGAWNDPTLNEGTGATADFNDSGGSPSVVNTDAYQVGTTAAYRVITSSGSNSVAFVWNSDTDQSSGNTTMCLQLTANDDTVDQTTPATQTLTIDNVNPSAPGNLTENNRRATQITLNYGSQASDTNDPGTNNYRLFYKAGTSGVAETDTEVDSADFDAWNYGLNSAITISPLSPNTDYVFNIWSYDAYCQTSVASCVKNKNKAAEITLKTRTGNFDVTASSSQSFNVPLTVAFTSQTSTISNIGAIKIIDDRGSDAGWTLNLTGNDWKTTTELKQLDYNGNGSDDNTGKLCAFSADANLYAESGSLTGVNKSVNDCFGSTVNIVDLVGAETNYGTGAYWLTDMSLEQFIPSNPTAAIYTTTIVFTLQ